MKQEPGKKVFFLFYGLFLAAGLYINLAYTQTRLFFWVNVHYSAFMDQFMELYTNVGDGVFCVALALIFLLFIGIRPGLAMLASFVLSGITVQILKRYFFTDHLRPWASFAHNDAIHLVKNFTPFTNNSFPSGHETTAFCMATLLVLIFPKIKPVTAVVLFVLTLLVAYSRIYLSQHYFLDVYVGSIVGALSSLLIYYYFYKRKYHRKRQFPWLDKPLLKVKR